MGLIKGIAEAVVQKAKNEMKEYILKVMETEAVEKKDDDQHEFSEDTPEENLEEDESTSEDTEKVEYDEEENDEESEILPLIEEDIIRLTFKTRPAEISMSRDITDILQFLPLNEFAVYLKLFIFCCDQKKNYGYLGNTLRKKTGLSEISNSDFDKIISNLQDYGFIEVEEVSENQRTFVLFVPFDKEKNSIVGTAGRSTGQSKKENNKKSSTKNRSGKSKKEKEEGGKKVQEPLKNELPGISVESNEDEDLYKSYRTYVSLEIDKAKMRVGRSNFDKIYMEAVKYIDKNFGFKVLSDSDKFKEYLTSYYISAFDIKTFEEWKKEKS